jgi:hypothetical protein
MAIYVFEITQSHVIHMFWERYFHSPLPPMLGIVRFSNCKPMPVLHLNFFLDLIVTAALNIVFFIACDFD